MEDSIETIARRRGWVVTIYPDFDGNFNLFTAKKPGVSEEEMLRISACIILGKLRDEHPNPTIADRAVDLLVALQAYARTID